MVRISRISRQRGSDDTWCDDTSHTRVTLGIMRSKCPTRRRGEEVEDTWPSKAMNMAHGIIKAMCQAIKH